MQFGSLLLFVASVTCFGGPMMSAPIRQNYYWTKSGLEHIPLSKWAMFSKDEAHNPYVAELPFPGDVFTSEHLSAWNSMTGMKSQFTDLLGSDIVSSDSVKVAVPSVPTLFNGPVVLEESAIDYRIAYSADLKNSTELYKSFRKGRLNTPSGRRLREHYYRFPDQCDATPIALEVFLRLLITDQIEAFFHPKRVGLWHDLFPEVQRRPYDFDEHTLARWYGSRYAESYMHMTTNGWVYPLKRQAIDTFMIAVGLNPDDMNMDPSTPIGLGNLVGKRVSDWLRDNDGLMKSMDYVDVDGLQRIEDFHPEKKWWQWQPTLAGSGRWQGLRFGIVTQQTFVSPSLGMFSFLYKDEAEFESLGLKAAVPVWDSSEEAYVRRAEKFMEAQRSMTDMNRALAELSNNKISGSVFLIKAFVPILKKLIPDHESNEYLEALEDFSMVTSGCAEYAATHAAWRHKRTYLAGRPQTVLRKLVKRNPAFAAKYPEAANFIPMIPPGDHSEYPSGSAVIYTAFAVSGDDWFKAKFGLEDASKNTGPLKFTIPAGKFYWLDGPKEDITLEFESLQDWIDQLPASRVYGGVHWYESGDAGIALGEKVGHACTQYTRKTESRGYVRHLYE